MMAPFPEHEEFRELLDALCEESISLEQVRRLEEVVLSRPEAEAYYVQYMSLYAGLAHELSAAPRAAERAIRGRLGVELPEASAEPVRAEVVSSAPRWRRGLFWSAIAASVAAATLLVAVLSFLKEDARLANAPEQPKVPQAKHVPGANEVPSPAPGPEPTDNTIAVLLHTQGAEWEPSGLPTQPGTPLPPGRLRLKSGFAQIEFYSGACVVLEGPADFELISPMEAYCSRGKLRATVPLYAQGFTIGSPQLDLIDRGTEFGLKVEGADTEVHVFEGRVELQKSAAANGAVPQQELTTGQALRLGGDEAARAIGTDSDGFLGAQDLAVRSQAEARRRHRDWLAASAALRRDPSLVLNYTFQTEDTWSRTLPNQAAGGVPGQDGTIVGCTWAAGRWPGKQALQFKQVSDRVKLHVPGEFDALTMAAWVWVDGLPNRFNSLLMTDSWDEGEAHWHIAQDGTIELGVQSPGRKDGAHYYARGSFGPDQFGKWAHLAVVYNPGDGKVRHYLNGAQIHEEFIVLEIPLRIGDAELGNWNITTRRHNHPIRYFNGRMDEFMLFSRALTPEELTDLYMQGRPQ